MDKKPTRPVCAGFNVGQLNILIKIFHSQNLFILKMKNQNYFCNIYYKGPELSTSSYASLVFVVTKLGLANNFEGYQII